METPAERPKHTHRDAGATTTAGTDARRPETEAGPEPGTSPGSFRVGSVRYLNALPLTCGIEHEVVFATPSQLAGMLRRDELDAGLVSVTEALFSGRYDVLDGISVASHREVRSVFLAHRGPIAGAREVFCDTASLTSVQLLRVLLAERGVTPEFRPLQSYRTAPMVDYAMLIGDPALDFLLAPHEHQIWDLGAAWRELTGLPFVYAVWALRRGIDHARLRDHLRAARDRGLATLDSLVRTWDRYDLDFRKDYLTRNIHYGLGPEEKRGLAAFVDLLRKHTPGPVHEPTFVA